MSRPGLPVSAKGSGSGPLRPPATMPSPRRPRFEVRQSSSMASASAPVSASRPSTSANDQYGRFQREIVPHLDAAYNFARFLSRNPDAAQDIVQEAFLRAYQALRRISGRRCPRLDFFHRAQLLSQLAAGRPPEGARGDRRASPRRRRRFLHRRCRVRRRHAGNRPAAKLGSRQGPRRSQQAAAKLARSAGVARTGRAVLPPDGGDRWHCRSAP